MIRIKSVSIFRGLTSGLPTGRLYVQMLIDTIIQVKIETFLFYKYWLQKQPPDSLLFCNQLYDDSHYRNQFQRIL